MLTESHAEGINRTKKTWLLNGSWKNLIQGYFGEMTPPTDGSTDLHICIRTHLPMQI